MTLLEAKDLNVLAGKKTLLQNIHFSLNANEWLMVCGPNGAGKTTLINAITGANDFSGTIELTGTSITQYSSKERARKIAVLTQKYSVLYDFTVREVVHLGRYAWRNANSADKGSAVLSDKEAIDSALEQCGLTGMQDRLITTLSGGELQRTFLAQVFAQQPQILLLDEPANNLDLVYQKNIFTLLQEWVKQDDHAILSVEHDLTTVKKYADSALLLDCSKQIAFDSIDKVLTRENLEQVYKLDVNAWMQEQLSVWN
ncbi:MAG: hypothetical protein BKP49_08080 [Treponema sp. CETP13]|nr:MAG: hypothetical protein BKP49_08080 [Treponema sp. CETP13]